MFQGKELVDQSETTAFCDAVMACGELELTANIDDFTMCVTYQSAGDGECCQRSGSNSTSNTNGSKKRKAARRIAKVKVDA